MHACRLQMAPMCGPLETPLSQDGVVLATCMWGVVIGLARVVPSFASWSLISFPTMPVCALRFWIMILCVDHMI